jgi:hypothetical protein
MRSDGSTNRKLLFTHVDRSLKCGGATHRAEMV